MEDVNRIAAAAAAYAAPDEEVGAVLAVEPAPGERLYLCAFTNRDGMQSWLALDDEASPVTDRKRIRDAASIAAISEVAEEIASLPEPDVPRVASLAYLDSLGSTAGNGNFAAAVQGAVPAVDELVKDVESNYKLELN